MDERMQESKKQLQEDFRVLLADVNELLDVGKDGLDKEAQKARERLKDRLDDLKERYSFLEQQAVSQVRDLEAKVQEKPFHALGITFAAGAFIGWLAGRK